jgi:hypothetical protein
MNKFALPINESLLITQKHQEYFLRVYCTDLSLVKKFNEYFEELSQSKNSSEDNSED